MSSTAGSGTESPAEQKASRSRGSARETHCARCGVISRWMPGHERRGPPAGWVRKGELTYCLACRRALATESADDRAPEGISREDRAKLRVQALIEFEIKRDPDRPNGEIAKVVRCSVPAVVKARRKLESV
jgi:hypothetical protein